MAPKGRSGSSGPKKAAKPRAKPKADAAAKVAPKEEDILAKAGDERLEDVLMEIFKCFDSNEDGLIERVEFLDGEEKRIGSGGGIGFGPRERRAAMAWFKDSGATGTPQDGMYLSPENFKVAFKKKMSEESEIPEAEAQRLADWIFEKTGKALIEKCCRGGGAAGAAGDAGAAAGPPEYPLTCKLPDLAKRVKEARHYGRNTLVLASGLEQVETFMSYEMVTPIDSKQILSEVLIRKSKSKEEAQENLRVVLGTSLNCTGGFVRPVWIRMANSAFDWANFTCDHFPSDLFSASLWSPQRAHDGGFIDAAQKMNVEVEDEKKWKEFYVTITSTFNLEQANEYLFDKIPHYDELAIILIDAAQ